jgi:stalled ribosome rescue protein Dom34
MKRRTALWIDHKEARICRIDPQELASVCAKTLHSKQSEEWRAEHSAQRRFFNEVASSLKGTDALLILGPSASKLDFVTYLQTHEPLLESKIVAVETVDQPSDSQLLAHVRHYFRNSDSVNASSTS